MDEERLADIREFSLNLIEKLFETGHFSHIDGFGGAELVVDIEEAVVALHKKGWTISKELDDG